MEKWNILSPDGFEISREDFKTKEEVLSYFYKWKNGFKRQGYYSSNKGKINLEELENYCSIIKLK